MGGIDIWDINQMECRMTTSIMGFTEGNMHQHTSYPREVLEVAVLEGRLWVDFKWMVGILLRWHEEKLRPRAGVRRERRERRQREERRERREREVRREMGGRGRRGDRCPESILNRQEVAYPLVQSTRGWRTLSVKNSCRVRSPGRQPVWGQ